MLLLNIYLILTHSQKLDKENLMKTEIWANHEIRFIEKEGEWWAVLSDIATALDLKPKHIKERLSDEVVSTDHIKDIMGRNQEMLIVNEFGIYETVFESRKAEAKEFKRWVFSILKELRQSAGIEGFGVFRMLDKQHQNQMMENLQQGLKTPKRVDYIKANTITNKAVSTMYGYPKSVKKGEMTPEMLVAREPILEDTVKLMNASDSFALGLSISKLVYDKYNAS